MKQHILFCAIHIASRLACVTETDHTSFSQMKKPCVRTSGEGCTYGNVRTCLQSTVYRQTQIECTTVKQNVLWRSINVTWVQYSIISRAKPVRSIRNILLNRSKFRPHIFVRLWIDEWIFNNIPSGYQFDYQFDGNTEPDMTISFKHVSVSEHIFVKLDKQMAIFV